MAGKSPYITREGYESLREEEAELWKKRRRVVKILAAAAAEGDRSENAEYIYRKKQLREMDRRIRYLQKRIPELKCVENPPHTTGQVFFGAWVTLEDENGEEVTYRIVGADEFLPAKNWISVDSPMARALLGKCLDEELLVHTPSGAKELLVLAISYQPPD
ncbi:transcription elongation factor GreB [Thiolapillus sp.]